MPDIAIPPLAHRLRLAGFALVALPAILFLGVIAVTSVNIPRDDDYQALLRFLCDWREAGSLGDRLQLLWAPFYNHRIVFTRGFALFDTALLGSLDLRVLQAAGWSMWLAFVAALVFTLPRMRARPWLALPVFLLLMQPQGHTNFHVTMQAVGNLGILLLAFGALQASASLRPGVLPLVAAACLGLTAIVALANGLLVLPCAAVLLALLGRWRSALVFALLALGGWIAFFAGFERGKTAFDFVEFVLNATVMTGAFLQFPRVPLAVGAVAGALLLAVTCLLLLRRATWQNWPAHAAFLLFLVLTIALAAVSRIGWGADYMLQDRYRVYGLVLAATLLLLALSAVPERRHAHLAGAALACTLPFNILSYVVTLPTLLTAARWCRATAINRQLDVAFPQTSAVLWLDSAALLDRAERLGVYRLPSLLSAADLAELRATRDTPPSFAFQAEANLSVEGALLVARPSASGQFPRATEFAVLHVGDRSVVLPSERSRAPLRELLQRPSWFARQTDYILPSANYVPGRHRFVGFARNPQGRLEQAWQALADCPALAFPGLPQSPSRAAP